LKVQKKGLENTGKWEKKGVDASNPYFKEKVSFRGTLSVALIEET